MADLKVYRCKHCFARFVIMDTQTGTWLPVEVKENESYDTTEVFNSSKHKSHLLTCIPRRMDWPEEQKRLKKLERSAIYNALNPNKLLD